VILTVTHNLLLATFSSRPPPRDLQRPPPATSPATSFLITSFLITSTASPPRHHLHGITSTASPPRHHLHGITTASPPRHHLLQRPPHYNPVASLSMIAMSLPDDIRGLHTAATGSLSQEDFDDHVQYAQAFLIYHTLFHEGVSLLDPPTQNDVFIINAACYDLYPTHWLESVFYRGGGKYALFGLIICMRRRRNKLSKSLEVIRRKPAEVWLAWLVSRRYKDILRTQDNWGTLEPNKNIIKSPPPRLGHHTEECTQHSPDWHYYYPERENLPDIFYQQSRSVSRHLMTPDSSSSAFVVLQVAQDRSELDEFLHELDPVYDCPSRESLPAPRSPSIDGQNKRRRLNNVCGTSIQQSQEIEVPPWQHSPSRPPESLYGTLQPPTPPVLLSYPPNDCLRATTERVEAKSGHELASYQNIHPSTAGVGPSSWSHVVLQGDRTGQRKPYSSLPISGQSCRSVGHPLLSNTSYQSCSDSQSPRPSSTVNIFDALNQPCKELARIMAFLHPGILKRMLFRAIEPFETFGHDGEIVKLPVLKFGLVSEQSGKLEPTLDELERQELLTFDPKTDCFTVPLAVRQHI
jgi:hypothetical protein